MIVPLKIVVCSLKSVKQLPGVQSDFPVITHRGVNFSTVYLSQGNLDSLVYSVLAGFFCKIIRIAPPIFEQMRNTFWECLMVLEEVV
jgi:hypothetical protein